MPTANNQREKSKFTPSSPSLTHAPQAKIACTTPGDEESTKDPADTAHEKSKSVFSKNMSMPSWELNVEQECY